jgi:aminopeptidase N
MLLSDAFALAGAGRGSPEAWLELLFAVPTARGQTREAVIDQARVQVGQLHAALAGAPAQAALERAARRLFGPELQALGWEPKAGESSERQSLRGALIDDLARWGDADVAARARAAFDADEAGRAPLPAALRSGVIRAVGARAGERQVAQLVARAKASQREEDQWLIAEALAGVADPAQARRVLELALDGSLPSQVAVVLPGLMAERGRHGELAYRHVLDHWAAYLRLAGSPWTQSRLLPSAASGFNDLAQAERLRADQQRLLGDAGAMMAARTAARIELAARLKQRDSEVLARRLAAWTDLPR